MKSNSRSVTDMDDQSQVIHVKEISVEFIKTRPISDLELVFKDDAGVIHKPYKFKNNGALIHWNVNIYVNTHTSATLTTGIQRALFKIRVAEVSVEFKPYQFGDDKVVRLEDSNHRVTVTFVHRKSKSLVDVTRVLDSQTTFTNTVAPMHSQQPRHRIPEVQFRVLIIEGQMRERGSSYKESVRQRRAPLFTRRIKRLHLTCPYERKSCFPKHRRSKAHAAARSSNSKDPIPTGAEDVSGLQTRRAMGHGSH
ncbi:hypothetical protein EDB85DRAFT_1317852 [Lactarius pseudohatsudake]|nr:hypothetical protein EDB85DRAFT_1317852 [Lactarius pseudohatsudake]